MSIEKVFIMDETCEFPNTCRDILCQRALVIEQENKYVEEKIAENLDDLEVVVNEATCKHPDALKAINDALPNLPKES